ncbi:penicillin acylase family protein [Paracoccaceae bacterium]|nr:penicillin acylase family protein [Paracoccaceae bacterium]
MKFLLKVLPYFLLASILFFLIILGFFLYLSYQSLPNYNKNLYSNDIKSKILIKTDLYAIPHITGNNDAETFFGLGYVHAQERLWQMTFLKRFSQGRLSEISGPKTILLDSFMKSLDLQTLASDIFQNLPTDLKQILSFYSQGINFRLKEIQEHGLGRGSPEFFFYSPEVTPWNPVDSLAIFKLVEFMSSNKALKEIELTNLLFSSVGEEKLNHLISDSSFFRSKLKEISSELNEGKFNKLKKLNYDNNTSFLSPLNAGFYSNVFAADGSRTASKKSLLLANLFLPLSSPSMWMLAHLDLNETSAVGATIPGVPVIFSGKNDYLAWGPSFSFVDDQDLYFEKLNPQNEEEYLSSSGYKKFSTQKKLIKVKNSPTLSFSVKRTENRVIIPHELYRMESIIPHGFLVSLAWTGFKKNDTTLETFLKLMSAKKVEEFKTKIPKNNSFNLIFVIADETEVNSVFIGNTPKRKKENETRGQIITYGWKSENQWDLKLEREIQPLVLSSKKGLFLNTNNSFLEEEFPNHLSFNWGDEQRLLRATKMINNREFHSVESFKELQNDFISEPARTLLPLMGKELWFQYNDDESDDINSIKARSLELLTNWNGDMMTNSPEPLIYSSWVKTFKKMILEDELGLNYYYINRISPLFLEKVLRNFGDAGTWCDIKHSNKIETCTELSKKSLTISLKKLKNEYGSDVNKWRWGNERRVNHPSFSADGILFPKFLREISSEISGSAHSLNSTMLNDMSQNNEAKASTFKMIIDFSSPNKNMFILPTGQSGHMLSKHYDDQTNIWKNGNFLFLSGTKSVVLGGSKGETIIYPSSIK